MTCALTEAGNTSPPTTPAYSVPSGTGTWKVMPVSLGRSGICTTTPVCPSDATVTV